MKIKKNQFTFGQDRRPLRSSPNTIAAAEKTFGVVRYTVGNPPKSAANAKPSVD